MNNQRRKEIADLKDRLDKVKDEIDEISSYIEDVLGEEQEYFENMPESFQQGEKGAVAEEAIGYLTEAYDEMGSALESLSSVGDNLENGAM